ncbi:MAG: nicotinate-nucleotide--dimethylbenzimidazole phosphoribosyltransferase [Piscirickettsiaceae bacterium]|nr:nicotinate-nucleotide--dimethylbenzimidazole phosphoribosyltransferase [Piscirickettsiaceae bacterium]
MTDFELWLASPAKQPDLASRQAALERQQQLTKPAGSLGQIEDIAVTLASLQANENPSVDRVQITVFAADHGIVEEGVSAFPQEVTGEMIRNFSRGGAAISVLAHENNAQLSVINMGTVNKLEPLTNVDDARIAAGTKNFLHHAAMTESQCQQALLIGQEHIEHVYNSGIQLFIGGEMGIGNTSSATAITCALLKREARYLVGPGTGLDSDSVQMKANIIQTALDKHHQQLDSPLRILHYVGGFEIAALVGAYIHCAKVGLPVLIDGFISSVAALLAEQICPGTQVWFLFSHQSAEPGHQQVLAELNATPLLSLGMRLGEASGAAMVLPLIKSSCALHNNMATFSQASVSQ